MPHLINCGPLDAGLFEFDTPPPGRVSVDLPARCGGPGVAVYDRRASGVYEFSGWRDDEDDGGEGLP